MRARDKTTLRWLGGAANPTAPCVLVTDAEYPGSLAVTRCLRDSGYGVTAVASTSLAPGLWSRSCAGKALVPPVSNGRQFVGALVDLLRRRPHDVLIPGSDASLFLLSRHRDAVEPYVPLGLPSHAVVERALNRLALVDYAAAAGIALPEEHICSDVETAVSAARQFGFPVLVKPVEVVTGSDGNLVRHSSRLACDEQALRGFAQRLPGCVVQRRIPGLVVSMSGVFTGGRLLAAVMGRLYRTWPPRAGSASFVESVSPDTRILERMEAFLQAAGWRGLWQLQFIERPDGVLHAIDFNPRPYMSMGLAAAAGAPLASLWCASLLGETPAPAIARPGVSWKSEDGDVRNVFWRLRHGRWRDALSVARTKADTHAYFSRRDPLPLLARVAELHHIGLSRLLKSAGG